MTLAPDSRASKKRVPLYEEVAERLRQKIYDYALPPGEWIDEPALAEELGISRTPLRESLKLLAAEGLVQLDAGRGSRVTRLTLEDLNQLFPVMAMLEGRCAHDAVKRIDAAGVQRLEELHAAMEAASAAGDVAEYYRNNYLIHETVQQYAGNPWLIRVTHDLHRILKMHRGRQLLTPGRMAQSLAEHRQLMDCVRRGDAEGAERTMHGHLLSQGQALAAYVAAGGMLNVPAPLPRSGGV
ncbi:GntR family transcriptional regulator [Xanthomonas phaseoli pv. phaseoli]|uniref:GntR family transcriptional regulator n=1 Tax=Xanthomonas campestris pv. phaseoli TaxID=317013 RepID=A0AB38E378_XANCH|nr:MULTISPECIES: GntR family transcriptional regulator [Xanthomonas]ATS23722.1 GntR family transcriptional regulator [Xanthomonas phaseoli pv. phaseoli]ATS26612.1 GntR family transcriptional regulator [Xanthomonas phaseoli pv. phaseoli]ATS29912.1 GntR family transcriptional regulator [Xanthomonas phaseoli pv. phaseoli]ATS34876.1 GntR family transcriptional regulator [Xanthomonas phaseoli pv. phaseoli]AZU11679.1 GntR family transcriptional regulator [Xanthomonas phaseoli pv. phaseoli]